MNSIKTPSTPNPVMAKVKLIKDDQEFLTSYLQKKYMKGFGTLLYRVKYSRPEIANITRELSKTMIQASTCDYNLLLIVLKYITRTSSLGLEFNISGDSLTWDFVSYVDSDWGGNTDNRKSVSGWCIFVNNCLLGWGSRDQKNVTLYSTEAVYVGISEISKEILFIKQVLEFVGVKIHLPITVYVDNMGAIFWQKVKDERGQNTLTLDIIL